MSFLPADPVTALTGFPVGPARRVGTYRIGQRSEHGFGIRQRNRADEMDRASSQDSLPSMASHSSFST